MANDAYLVTQQNIDSFRQNKLRYVEADLSRLAGVPPFLTRRILRARGVEKWIANRHLFIRLKHDLKDQIRKLNETICLTHGPRRQRLVGQMEGLVEARQAIRAICHSPRWRPNTE